MEASGRTRYRRGMKFPLSWFSAGTGNTHLDRAVVDPVAEQHASQAFALLLRPAFRLAKVELRKVVVVVDDAIDLALRDHWLERIDHERHLITCSV